MIPKRVLAASTGTVSLFIVLLPTETQIAAYMVFGIVLGASWASKGLRWCLQGMITGAMIGAILSFMNEVLTPQVTEGFPMVTFAVVVFRVAFPAALYFGVASVPSLRC